MSKKTLSIIFIAILVIFTALTVRFIIGDAEDAWICQNGEWVKHGEPGADQPTTGCGGLVADEIIIRNFFDCIVAGNPVMESYPRQCRTEAGETFTEDIGNELKKTDLIIITSPRPNQVISSPLTITGEARGYWFFEGDFPAQLLDKDGNILSEGIMSAQSDPLNGETSWMTEDFVPFSGEMEFNVISSQIAVLVLKKDNPSNLPENDDDLRIPVLIDINIK